MKIKLTFFIITIIFFTSCELGNNKNYDFKLTELMTNSDSSLRGLFVVDEEVVWASGSNGSVLLSNDGGITWSENQIVGAEENDFRSIHAWDEKSAMVFGVSGPAFGYLTKDGGASWDVVFQDSTQGLFFNSLKFADENNGLAVSDPIDGKFFVLRTEDGGEKWERIEAIPAVEQGEANFAASNTCIEFLPTGEAWIASGGKAARVFYSTDYGKSWDVVKTPMVRGQSSSGIFSVSFKNNMEGVIVGGTYDKPDMNYNIAAFTTDGGESWQTCETMPLEYRSCVQLVSNEIDNFFFAIGKTGCDYSVDGGENWNFMDETGYYTFRSVPGKLSGFVAGSEGRVGYVSFTK